MEDDDTRPLQRSLGGAYGDLRMRRRPRPWLMVLACAIVGLVLAVTVLGGAAQGLVGIVSGFALLFAAVRGLDSPDVQNVERHVARDEVGSGNYHSGMGTRLHEPSPVGPVNTPEQDSIDALERSWRAPSPGDK
jgi:uncharacterized protein (DUF58 family)